jgi:hypothetical protein
MARPIATVKSAIEKSKPAKALFRKTVPIDSD